LQKITHVETLANYRIKLSFEDGLKGTIDLSDMVGKGVFAVWTDPDKFAMVSIDPLTHTVSWLGGIDLCADSLHDEIAQQDRAA
jgi:hypothetical protein